ncbi:MULTISPECIES: hypothetical protein [Xanthomonas]|uniref:hypothetical protein n=1 Tax=Xanthomonas TaxID=338 RepID=UPI001E53AE36|nr:MULTISPECIES: hypothetical protein [Xanthomonas]MCC5085439.1 hypothetical protein [Xanthomonas campestris]MCS3807154.1 apolipoprotein N-acyltransferase [Xanthomonas sp. 4461]
MHQEAERIINHGLSLGARLLLGVFAMLFCVVLVLVAPPTDKAIYFYLFSAFCLLLFLACFTQGRVRQFIGSLIGCTIFGLGIWYLVIQLSSDPAWPGARSQPSVLNAFLYLLFIGVPGAAYAYRARFGMRRKP